MTRAPQKFSSDLDKFTSRPSQNRSEKFKLNNAYGVGFKQ